MYHMLEAHPFTVFILVAAMVATPFYLLATYVFSEASAKKGLILGTIALVLGGIMTLICLANIPEKLGMPGNLIVPLTWILPSLLLFFCRDWALTEPLSSKWLIGLQAWRFIGGVFLIEMFRHGKIPGIFAYPAGLGDIAVATVALIVLLAYKNRRALPAKAIHLVGILGALDFISAFFFGFFSTNTPVQLFSHDNPNQVLLFPTGLIPLFFVPLAIFYHTLTWLNLAKHGDSV